MQEGINLDKKSIKFLKSPNWKELAKDCVCFANHTGGKIIIGIEDKKELPEPNQKIEDKWINEINKRIKDHTFNVYVDVSIETAVNGGEYIIINVYPSRQSIASTSDGRYYIRVGDLCKPILPDELGRLFNDKPAFIWETTVVRKIKYPQCDKNKLESFIKDIKSSKRVSEFVKSKDIRELLEHYLFIDDEGNLTNLGVLWLGTKFQRARLAYAPVVQLIKYDQNEEKIYKKVWDDYSLNPKELIIDIWKKIPEWKEGVEVSDGLFRKFIPNYPEEVVRELLVNALVHRPYTIKGDITIKIYPDRIEFCNPGPLPIGVTPNNILHQSVRRNEHLARVFFDLELMEREGSGYDKIYETLLTLGKKLPVVKEQYDKVCITIFKSIQNEQIIRWIFKIKNELFLSQKETIALGVIAQKEFILATELIKILQLDSADKLKPWIDGLLDKNIILKRGHGKGTRYFINPDVLRNTEFVKTNLKKIPEHRLKELILSDLTDFPYSTISEIHNRIGKEIDIRRLRSVIYKLVKANKISYTGGKKFRKYFISKNCG